jgi:hypothetical protein
MWRTGASVQRADSDSLSPSQYRSPAMSGRARKIQRRTEGLMVGGDERAPDSTRGKGGERLSPASPPPRARRRPRARARAPDSLVRTRFILPSTPPHTHGSRAIYCAASFALRSSGDKCAVELAQQPYRACYPYSSSSLSPEAPKTGPRLVFLPADAAPTPSLFVRVEGAALLRPLVPPIPASPSSSSSSSSSSS